VIVQIARGGFVFDEARSFLANLEEEMNQLNPGGVETLRSHVGDDLSELKMACRRALDANDENNHLSALVFDPQASDNATIGEMKDVVERMAEVTGRKVHWEIKNKKKALTARVRLWLHRKSNFAKKNRLRSLSLKALTELPRHELERNSGSRVELRTPSSAARGFTSRTLAEVTNVESALFICCSRRDAVLQARLLRSELSIKLGRGCAVGGGKDSAAFINKSDAMVVLLTKRLPTDTHAIFEIWTALRLGMPLIPVAISGAGFDYETAAADFSNLLVAVENASPGGVAELKARLPQGVDIAQIGKKLQASLMAIIAISWNLHQGRNHTNAVVADILQRVPKKDKRASAMARNSVAANYIKSRGGSSYSMKSVSSRPTVVQEVRETTTLSHGEVDRPVSCMSSTSSLS